MKWAKASGIRALKTFCQTFASMITVGMTISEIDWVTAVSVSAVAGFLSILTSVAGLPELEGGAFDEE